MYLRVDWVKASSRLREQRGRMEGTERNIWGKRGDFEGTERRSWGPESRIWGNREEVWIKHRGIMEINERRIWGGCVAAEEDLREQRGGYEGREKDQREWEDMRIRKGWFQRDGSCGSAWTGREQRGGPERRREKVLKESPSSEVKVIILTGLVMWWVRNFSRIFCLMLQYNIAGPKRGLMDDKH